MAQQQQRRAHHDLGDAGMCTAVHPRGLPQRVAYRKHRRRNVEIVLVASQMLDPWPDFGDDSWGTPSAGSVDGRRVTVVARGMLRVSPVRSYRRRDADANEFGMRYLATGTVTRLHAGVYGRTRHATAPAIAATGHWWHAPALATRTRNNWT